VLVCCACTGRETAARASHPKNLRRTLPCKPVLAEREGAWETMLYLLAVPGDQLRRAGERQKGTTRRKLRSGISSQVLVMRRRPAAVKLTLRRNS
jgi:hypothetical protein